MKTLFKEYMRVLDQHRAGIIGRGIASLKMCEILDRNRNIILEYDIPGKQWPEELKYVVFLTRKAGFKIHLIEKLYKTQEDYIKKNIDEYKKRNPDDKETIKKLEGCLNENIDN